MEFCRHSLIFRPGYKAARRLVVYFFVSVWVLGSISHLCCALSEYKTAHASRPACIRRSIANPRVLARTPPRRLLPLRGGARGGPGRRAGSKGGSTKRKRGRHATDGHKKDAEGELVDLASKRKRRKKAVKSLVKRTRSSNVWRDDGHKEMEVRKVTVINVPDKSIHARMKTIERRKRQAEEEERNRKELKKEDRKTRIRARGHMKQRSGSLDDEDEEAGPGSSESPEPDEAKSDEDQDEAFESGKWSEDTDDQPTPTETLEGPGLNSESYSYYSTERGDESDEGANQMDRRRGEVDGDEDGDGEEGEEGEEKNEGNEDGDGDDTSEGQGGRKRGGGGKAVIEAERIVKIHAKKRRKKNKENLPGAVAIPLFKGIDRTKMSIEEERELLSDYANRMAERQQAEDSKAPEFVSIPTPQPTYGILEGTSFDMQEGEWEQQIQEEKPKSTSAPTRLIRRGTISLPDLSTGRWVPDMGWVTPTPQPTPQHTFWDTLNVIEELEPEVPAMNESKLFTRLWDTTVAVAEEREIPNDSKLPAYPSVFEDSADQVESDEYNDLTLFERIFGKGIQMVFEVASNSSDVYRFFNITEKQIMEELDIYVPPPRPDGDLPEGTDERVYWSNENQLLYEQMEAQYEWLDMHIDFLLRTYTTPEDQNIIKAAAIKNRLKIDAKLKDFRKVANLEARYLDKPPPPNPHQARKDLRESLENDLSALNRCLRVPPRKASNVANTLPWWLLSAAASGYTMPEGESDNPPENMHHQPLSTLEWLNKEAELGVISADPEDLIRGQPHTYDWQSQSNHTQEEKAPSEERWDKGRTSGEVSEVPESEIESLEKLNIGSQNLADAWVNKMSNYYEESPGGSDVETAANRSVGFAPGSRVEVTEGIHKGYVGVVVGLDEITLNTQTPVDLRIQVALPLLPRPVQISPEYLKSAPRLEPVIPFSLALAIDNNKIKARKAVEDKCAGVLARETLFSLREEVQGVERGDLRGIWARLIKGKSSQNTSLAWANRRERLFREARYECRRASAALGSKRPYPSSPYICSTVDTDYLGGRRNRAGLVLEVKRRPGAFLRHVSPQVRKLARHWSTLYRRLEDLRGTRNWVQTHWGKARVNTPPLHLKHMWSEEPLESSLAVGLLQRSIARARALKATMGKGRNSSERSGHVSERRITRVIANPRAYLQSKNAVIKSLAEAYREMRAAAKKVKAIVFWEAMYGGVWRLNPGSLVEIRGITHKVTHHRRTGIVLGIAPDGLVRVQITGRQAKQRIVVLVERNNLCPPWRACRQSQGLVDGYLNALLVAGEQDADVTSDGGGGSKAVEALTSDGDDDSQENEEWRMWQAVQETKKFYNHMDRYSDALANVIMPTTHKLSDTKPLGEFAIKMIANGSTAGAANKRKSKEKCSKNSDAKGLASEETDIDANDQDNGGNHTINRGGSTSEEFQLRLDPQDSMPYNRAEFLSEYGSLREWRRAVRMPSDGHKRIDMHDQKPYTLREFVKFYGDDKEWRRAPFAPSDVSDTEQNNPNPNTLNLNQVNPGINGDVSPGNLPGMDVGTRSYEYSQHAGMGYGQTLGGGYGYGGAYGLGGPYGSGHVSPPRAHRDNEPQSSARVDEDNDGLRRERKRDDVGAIDDDFSDEDGSEEDNADDLDIENEIGIVKTQRTHSAKFRRAQVERASGNFQVGSPELSPQQDQKDQGWAEDYNVVKDLTTLVDLNATDWLQINAIGVGGGPGLSHVGRLRYFARRHDKDQDGFLSIQELTCALGEIARGSRRLLRISGDLTTNPEANLEAKDSTLSPRGSESSEDYDKVPDSILPIPDSRNVQKFTDLDPVLSPPAFSYPTPISNSTLPLHQNKSSSLPSDAGRDIGDTGRDVAAGHGDGYINGTYFNRQLEVSETDELASVTSTTPPTLGEEEIVKYSSEARSDSSEYTYTYTDTCESGPKLEVIMPQRDSKSNRSRVDGSDSSSFDDNTPQPDAWTDEAVPGAGGVDGLGSLGDDIKREVRNQRDSLLEGFGHVREVKGEPQAVLPVSTFEAILRLALRRACISVLPHREFTRACDTARQFLGAGRARAVAIAKTGRPAADGKSRPNHRDVEPVGMIWASNWKPLPGEGSATGGALDEFREQIEQLALIESEAFPESPEDKHLSDDMKFPLYPGERVLLRRGNEWHPARVIYGGPRQYFVRLEYRGKGRVMAQVPRRAMMFAGTWTDVHTLGLFFRTIRDVTDALAQVDKGDAEGTIPG